MNLVIVDTSCANLSSVKFAFERLGVNPVISADASVIRSADRVILPGVGTAKAAMRNLHQLGLVDTLRQLQQPVLGICLGMQLLTESSAEGNVDCLGVIPTRTKAMQQGLESAQFPLPHMGWNTVVASTDNPLLKGLDSSAYCYFVHSFAVATDAYTLATTQYGNTRFASMIGHGNFFGAQFHPERSGKVGATILKNFMELTDADSRT
ncbi:imidazole glycerol phosphate synthase subunit HisH [Pseudidiomarina sp. 1APR75-15]|uniref:Imidazole glycerol phosphate synthase subunit HisH n=1 Tax=Pseudidiomarina terrestris TaxID=2820060 RepID=A0ABT8MG00_9GAMM|nr:imidazole glycerol phosphate synthase subunit HisH [Pseudidiomarina sp. 1APR75-15]MDN7128863.1 imidazole glycerol phosphate synthase subunit HisH [Pseudidiomarina sp. 1APR75-15]